MTHSCMRVILMLSAVLNSFQSYIPTPGEYQPIITLTNHTFSEKLYLGLDLDDLWLISFISPSCSYSKELYSSLNEVAPFITDLVNIGIVDCSMEADLCSSFNIQGYPTMKWFRDGKFHDYSGERTKDSILEFTRRMSQPAVELFPSYNYFLDHLVDIENETEVAYIVYDSSGNLCKQSFENLQRCSDIKPFYQVARLHQLENSLFGVLQHSEKNNEWLRNVTGTSSMHSLITLSDGIQVLSIEKDSTKNPTLYEGDWTFKSLSAFVEKTKNGVLVPQMLKSNILDFGTQDKYLAIAVLELGDKERSSNFLAAYRQYSKRAPGHIRRQYKMVWINGREWESFLSKYSIMLSKDPILFVLDYPFDLYWKNLNEPLRTTEDIHSFLDDVYEGKVLSKFVETNREKSHDGKMFGMFDGGLSDEQIQYIIANRWCHVLLLGLTFLAIMGNLDTSSSLYKTWEKYILEPFVDPWLLGNAESEASDKNAVNTGKVGVSKDIKLE